MTAPQQDPAQDITAALARLAEQTIGLQRQLNRMETVMREQNHITSQMVRDAETRIRELTDAKFVTYETLITSQAEKVALALSATEKAIAVADEVTARAIEKAEVANDKRFTSVNEFRQQLNDQARTFMPRTEALQLSEQATQRIRELADRIPSFVTRDEVRVMTDRNAERVAELSDRINRFDGQRVGAKDNRAGLISIVAVAVSILIASIALFNFISTQ